MTVPSSDVDASMATARRFDFDGLLRRTHLQLEVVSGRLVHLHDDFLARVSVLNPSFTTFMV